MAEIRIEEKKSPNLLPWILGLLALLLVAGLFLIDFDNDDDNLVENEATEEVEYIAPKDATDAAIVAPGVTELAAMDLPQRVATFVKCVERPAAKMNLEHDYTRENLRLLAGSLDAMANNYDLDDVALKAAADELREQAAVLDNNWRSTKHADHIQNAFVAATKVMERLQEKYIPNAKAEVNAVVSQVEKLNTKDLTLDQKKEIKGFFDAAADAVLTMAQDLEATEELSSTY